jgi:hypothetical protein
VATKIENKTTAMQSPAGTADSLAPVVGPSEPRADRPITESEQFAPHLESSNNAPTPMDEDNTEEDDLLGEDLVDYGASPEHTEN